MFSCTNDIDCSPGMVCEGSKSYCRLKSDNSDGTLCTGIICREGEGGCRSDSECDGSLLCGTDNCAIGPPGMGCCTNQCNGHSDCTSGECNAEHNCLLNSDTVDWSRCSQDSPCADGEGDCDNDGECEGLLVCGKPNDKCSNGPSTMDCCIGKLVGSCISADVA